MPSKFAFDTFLKGLPESSPEVAAPPSSASTAFESVRSKPNVAAPSVGQPIDLMMVQLKAGPKTVRDFAPLFGNSVGLALDTVEKLMSLGYVSRGEGDRFMLTPVGEQVAASLADK